MSLSQPSENKQPADFFEHELMTKRPEQLALQQFVELTNYVAEYIK
jgi:16S rRNA (adenine1518-N6/adenine1519-N6)-dimethyltransferase